MPDVNICDAPLRLNTLQNVLILFIKQCANIYHIVQYITAARETRKHIYAEAVCQSARKAF